MAYLQTGTISSTKIEVRVNDIADYYDGRYIIWYLDGDEYEEIDINDGGTSSDWYIFDGLDPDTDYTIEAYIYAEIPYLGYSMIDSCEETFTTKNDEEDNENVTGDRPDYFEWDSTKVKGRAFKITVSEWCALLDNINAVRVYKGYPKMPEGTGVATFTYPSKGDTFTATMYNQCIYAMSEKNNVGWIEYTDHRVLSGDPITAASLNFLRDTINDIE